MLKRTVNPDQSGKTKYILTLLLSLLWLIGCSDSGVTNPVTQEKSLQTLIGEEYLQNRILFKSKPAAQIVYAPPRTYYECGSGGVIAATGGEDLFGGCQVWNDIGLSYTLEILGPHDFFLSEVSTVQITNPVKVDFRNDEGHWVAVTVDTTVTTEELRVRGNGSARLSTSALIDIHSGNVER